MGEWKRGKVRVCGAGWEGLRVGLVHVGRGQAPHTRGGGRSCTLCVLGDARVLGWDWCIGGRVSGYTLGDE